MQQPVDGLEAYRDDPEYTSPEMQPGNGEDIHPAPNTDGAIVTGAAMTGGAGGGALLGTALMDAAEDERAEFTPRLED